MLTCVYHPIDAFRVVEEDEARRLKQTGVWFDSPKKAKEYREKVEQEIKEESNGLSTKAKDKGKSK
jgi:hypothetical protein